jgi:integrase
MSGKPLAFAALAIMFPFEIGLRWLDIDFKGGRILLPQTKNGNGRIVYLNTLAQQALAAVPQGTPTQQTSFLLVTNGHQRMCPWHFCGLAGP